MAARDLGPSKKNGKDGEPGDYNAQAELQVRKAV